MRMSRFRRATLGPGFGYTPGEQPADGEGWLKLNSNESPLPPSPRIAEAVAAAAAGLARYPDPQAEPLRSALARYHHVEPEHVFVANGADQVLDCLFRAFVGPGDTLVRTEPGYSLLPVLATLFSACDVGVPVEPDGSLPSQFASQDAVLRIVVNPNSPTGHWIEPAALERSLDGASGVIAVDEAYCDFAPASCVERLAGHRSWVVVRTLSKSHALAGLRIGYALGDPELIDDLNAVRDSYPVDRCAIAGALAALDDEPRHREIVDTVVRERNRLSDGLRGLGWEVADSGANFILARPPLSTTAVDVGAHLRTERILVRHFDTSGLGDRLRISIGDGTATDRVLAAVASMQPRGEPAQDGESLACT
ncbi:MAG TPA: histidinol-phosphate transaminase [Candidatus Acidoferrales bacterium]|nr:histidinol-phosphate transaminase [Candidatus Acidoferrales bacterium]